LKTPTVINVVAELHKNYINNGINNSVMNCNNSQHFSQHIGFLLEIDGYVKF